MLVNLGHIHIRRMFHHPKHHIPKYFFRSEMPAHFLLFKNNIKKTYAELFQEIHLCTMSFLKMGIEHNDKICIFSENNGNWFAVEQGIERAGGISVLRGSKLSPNAELEYIYKNSEI
mgnify:CR=1 FL=1